EVDGGGGPSDVASLDEWNLLRLQVAQGGNRVELDFVVVVRVEMALQNRQNEAMEPHRRLTCRVVRGADRGVKLNQVRIDDVEDQGVLALVVMIHVRLRHPRASRNLRHGSFFHAHLSEHGCRAFQDKPLLFFEVVSADARHCLTPTPTASSWIARPMTESPIPCASVRSDSL